MKIETFIKKARTGDGGEVDYCCDIAEEDELLEPLLLDTRAWAIVGKSMGWKNLGIFKEPGHREVTEAEMHMHNMIDALWEGGTIEEYIETL